MIVIVCINEVNSGPPPKNPVRWLIFTRHLRLGKCFLHEQNKWARRAKDEGAGDPGFLRMQNSLPVVYEMMHFVHFSPPLLPRKHLNPLKTPNAHAVCFSNAHSPSPPFSGSPRLPKKKSIKNSLRRQIATWTNTSCWTTHVLQFYFFFPFPNMVLSHSLLSHLMGTAFTFCHYCTLWFNSPGSRGGRTEVKAAWKADTHSELFKFIFVLRYDCSCVTVAL